MRRLLAAALLLVMASGEMWAAQKDWDEKFETDPGTDESWDSSDGSGGTLDPDTATSGVTGTTGDWGTYCLESTVSSTGTCKYEEDTATYTAFYFRTELIINSHSIPDANYSQIFAFASSNWSNYIVVSVLNDGGDVRLRVSANTTGSDQVYTSGVLSLDTAYRLEFKWDADNDSFEWRIDGETQDTVSLTGSHQADVSYVELGVSATSYALSTYMDLVAWGDTDWIGAESGGAGASIPIIQHYRRQME